MGKFELVLTSLSIAIRCANQDCLRRMTTLKDVAELAGISTATASLALNGGKVNEETRQRVLSVARRLNYVPNRIGRMLNTGLSGTICLLFMTSTRHADIVHHTSLFYYL